MNSIHSEQNITPAVKPLEKASQKGALLSVIASVMIAIAIIAVVLAYGRFQKDRLLTYGDYTVNQIADNIAGNITTTIAYGKSSIQNVAVAVAGTMSSAELENPADAIGPLVEKTPFDGIEYIRPDGMNVMNIGQPFDASDRVYFREGIKGNTDTWNNYHPKMAKESLINFYTPLIYDGAISGVVTGYIRATTELSPMLQADFFGSQVEGVLCDGDGMVIASSLDMEFIPDLTLATFLGEFGSDAEEVAKFTSLLTNETDGAVKYTDKNGEGRICVKSIPGTDWTVSVIVSAVAFRAAFARSMHATYLAIAAVCVLLALYLLFIFFKNSEERKKAAAENAQLALENEKFNRENQNAFDELKRLNHSLEESACEQEAQLKEITTLNAQMEEKLNIIQSMSKVYFTSFYLNLVDDYFVEICSIEAVRQFIGTEGKPQRALNLLCEKMVADSSAEELRTFTDLSTVNERMKDKQVITCDYLGNVAGWCQLFFIVGERNSDGTLKTIFVAARTIHDEKMREEQQNQALIEARQNAEKANKAKTSFLFNMSHDIRTPMNAIIGYTDLLQRYRGDAERFDDYIEKVKKSSQFLLTLINNVLEVARIESGLLQLDESVCDLERLLLVVQAVFEEQMREKNICFHVEINVQHPQFWGDIVKLREIYLNLLSNAYKYTMPGGRISLVITESPCEQEGRANYQAVISDTGIGMSEDFLPHLFDEFTRERSVTENKIQGTGLGMAIVKQYVEAMGGTIDVASELGKGTAFTVKLTCRIAAQPDTNSEEEANRGVLSFTGKRILLAEDNELNAEIAIEILSDYGFAIDLAEDGVICVDKLIKAEAGYYDVVLMDIQMPNMNGYDAARKIRALPDPAKAAVPIFAMTANAFEEDKKTALAAGMNGHLAKPIDVTKLIGMLSTVIPPSGSRPLPADSSPVINRAEQFCKAMKTNNLQAFLPGGFFAYEAYGDEALLFANDTACEIWGCHDLEELKAYTGGTFRGLVHPEDYDAIEASIWEQIERKNDNMDRVVYRIIRKDGAVRWLNDYGHLVRDKEYGDVFYVFVADMTDKKTKE